ncbi:hypothetical protein JTB14_025223 [Gonioctena quinquepunctata]|nr:hypothetical protein JTB14_025223 [Gonioctena quinquepunctata]
MEINSSDEMESSSGYIRVDLPKSMIKVLKKYYQVMENEVEIAEDELITPRKEFMEHITLEMGNIINLEDFETYLAEDYDTDGYDSIILYTQDHNLRGKMKKLEFQYRTQRLEDVFRLFVDTTNSKEYISVLCIEKYEEELKIVKRKIKKCYPDIWDEFEKMHREFYDKYNETIHSNSTREPLVDYFMKNNEFEGSEGETPRESQSTGEKPPPMKPKNQEEKPNPIPEDSQKSQELEKAGKHQ